MSRQDLIWRPLRKWAFIIGALLILRIVLPLVLDQAAGNVAKFVTGFMIFLLTFISIGVNLTGRILRNQVPMRLYRTVEYTMIAGVLAGVVCVFQPWSVDLYRIGWLVLLAIFFLFIVWGHITPANAEPTKTREPDGTF